MGQFAVNAYGGGREASAWESLKPISWGDAPNEQA